jgi:hypothetical protein
MALMEPSGDVVVPHAAGVILLVAGICQLAPLKRAELHLMTWRGAANSSCEARDAKKKPLR